MKITQLLAVIVLSAVTSVVAVNVIGNKTEVVQIKETAYQRVMRTGTIRCGYVLAPSLLQKDVTTGALSGLSYLVTEELARRLGLKTAWVEEVGYDGMFEGLKTGRYDMLCTPISASPTRAKATLFSQSFLFAPYYAYVRADDNRFDSGLAAINDPAVKFAVLDGEMSLIVKNEDFPKAQAHSLSSPADVSQVLLDVSSGKADVALALPVAADPFMKNNIGKLRPLKNMPVRYISANYAMPVDAFDLKSLIDTTLDSLLSTGYLARVTVDDIAVRDYYMLPAQPWRRAGE